jgi:hypothetical protein
MELLHFPNRPAILAFHKRHPVKEGVFVARAGGGDELYIKIIIPDRRSKTVWKEWKKHQQINSGGLILNVKSNLNLY